MRAAQELLTPTRHTRQATAQVITTIVAIFFGMFMNIIIISSATTALQSLDSKQMVGRQQLETITRYLLFKNVPNTLTCQAPDGRCG